VHIPRKNENEIGGHDKLQRLMHDLEIPPVCEINGYKGSK